MIIFSSKDEHTFGKYWTTRIRQVSSSVEQSLCSTMLVLQIYLLIKVITEREKMAIYPNNN